MPSAAFEIPGWANVRVQEPSALGSACVCKHNKGRVKRSGEFVYYRERQEEQEGNTGAE